MNRARTRKLGLGVLLSLTTLCALEGLFSFLFLSRDLVRAPSRELAEARTTRFDPELGWVSLPDLHLPDFYGDGGDLTTNARGFRGEAETSPAIPDGRVRVVCSGDSFTLGFGVSDSDAWPARMARLDPRLDVVNMGQGGYGLDQAYLWYERERPRLEHDVQLFAFIYHDFDRMLHPEFLDVSRPTLGVIEGELVLREPAREPGSALSVWMTRNESTLERSALWRAARGVVHRLRRAEELGPRPEDEIEEVARAIFESLAATHDRDGSQLVMVYLPARADCAVLQPLPWREFAAAEAARLDVPLIDLAEEFRSKSRADIDALFLQEGEVDAPGAAGHYTVAGNALVAELIHERLVALPGVAARLTAASGAAR